MKNILFYSILLLLASCRPTHPKEDRVSEPESIPAAVQTPALTNSEIQKKIGDIKKVAWELLKQSDDPRSKEIMSFWEHMSLARLDTITKGGVWRNYIIENRTLLTLVVADTSMLNSVAQKDTIWRNLANNQMTMLFIPPDSVNKKSLVKILIKWQMIIAQNDTLNALSLLHEILHVCQWEAFLRSKGNRAHESFSREREAWSYQTALWIGSLPKETRSILEAKKNEYKNIPSLLEGGIGIHQDDVDQFQKLFGGYRYYWPMFLDYTYGDEFIKKEYPGLKP